MSQVTGKKVAVTPMPTPTGSEGAIINSWNTSDDKTKNAPSMQLVKNDLDTINDNLTTLDNYTKANKLESKTNIGAYNSFANRYTFPSDGYLEIGSTETTARIYGSNATADTDTRVKIQTPVDSATPLFVKKGMSAYIVQSGKVVYFYPLS